MKEQAELYRVGLLLGLFKLSDVIAWCDSVIMEEDHPDIALIEASLSGSKGVNAVADALAEVPGEFDQDSVTRGLFRSMHDLVSQDREQAPRVARLLYRMALDDRAMAEDEPEMWYFGDAFDDAENGYYGNVEDPTQELLQFLEKQATLTD